MSILPIEDGWELYCEPHLQGAADGSGQELLDYSGHNRHLSTDAAFPVVKTAILNNRDVMRFNETTGAFNNPELFSFRSGFIVSKFNGNTFPQYKGLLTGITNFPILIGSVAGIHFYNFNQYKYEFRANHRIYLQEAAIAPMNAWHITFFKFWGGVITDGVQLGQDRYFTDRKWNGDVALLAMTNRNLDEEKIDDYTRKISSSFALPIADAYPYQSDIGGHSQEPEADVNFYDPPEGARISEVVSPLKESIELKFSGAGTQEIDFFLPFFKSHYQTSLPFIYRDYRFGIPRDFEGYFDSMYEMSGENSNFAYGFKMRAK